MPVFLREVHHHHRRLEQYPAFTRNSTADPADRLAPADVEEIGFPDNLAIDTELPRAVEISVIGLVERNVFHMP